MHDQREEDADGGVGNVGASFDMLLEEVDLSIESVNQTGAHAFATGDLAAVERAFKRAATLRTFRGKVADLHKEWTGLAARVTQGQASVLDRPATNRLGPNARTPESAFVGPILAALVARGGSGRMPEVLADVGERMRDMLRPVDFEMLPSQPTWPRWRNSAQWARNTMVKEGLLRSDSPHGTWEITDAGRGWLETHQ